MNEKFIEYRGNYYLVYEDAELKDCDLCVTLDGVNYKISWCYEKEVKFSYTYFDLSFPWATGVTFNPTLIANELVAVQPLDGPIGELVYMDFVYNN
jgi:hypothetical protein